MAEVAQDTEWDNSGYTSDETDESLSDLELVGRLPTLQQILQLRERTVATPADRRAIWALDEAEDSENESGNDDDDDDDDDDNAIDLIGRLPSLEQIRLLGFSTNPSFTGLTHYRTKLMEWYFDYSVRTKLQSNGEDVSPLRKVALVPERLSEHFPSLRSLGFSLNSLMSWTHVAAKLNDGEPETIQELPDLDVSDADREAVFFEGHRGCVHYQRNCKVHCINCGKWYPCRLCHDEKEKHPLPRRETKYMLCMLCHTPQAAGRECVKCQGTMASYYCSTCKLWSGDECKAIFHCDDCGICRVGQGLGIDTFHCLKCGICMNLMLENSHRCIERSTHSNCPICQDYLFSSTELVIFMRCGHPIHQHCYQSYLEQSYKCPVCSRSIVDTSAIFRIIDEEVRQEILPPDLAALSVDVLCHDCNGRSRILFHIAGLKCAICYSYNTTRI